MGFRVKADGMTCSFANKHISTETKTVWKYIREVAVIRIGDKRRQDYDTLMVI